MASFRDEELAEKVYQFPALYDKSHSHFHRMDIKSNAWQKVANDLEFENGECWKIRFVCTRSSRGNVFLKIHILDILEKYL